MVPPHIPQMNDLRTATLNAIAFANAARQGTDAVRDLISTLEKSDDPGDQPSFILSATLSINASLIALLAHEYGADFDSVFNQWSAYVVDNVDSFIDTNGTGRVKYYDPNTGQAGEISTDE